MVLQWYGQSYFRVDTKGVVIAIDPFSKTTEWGINKVPRFRADIVLVSHQHPDHNNITAIEGNPRVFLDPGEYETQGVFIEGIPSFHDEANGKERGPNTIFVIEAEDLRVCHMGDIGTKKLSEETLERIGEVDILLLPVGGKYTVDALGAWDLIHLVEPAIAIPMHYKVPGLKLPIEDANRFLKKVGVEPEPLERLSVKKRDISPESFRVEVLRPLAFV